MEHKGYESLAGHTHEVSKAADYSGVAWDDAADEVLRVMAIRELSVADAIEVYRASLRDAHRSQVKIEQSTTYEVHSYKVPLVVMEVALDLAQGDLSRLRVAKDGSITVVNKSRRTYGS